MESVQSIKKRMRGVTNTQKITKAMEMVSAQKMRKSQEIALASRPYAIRGLELLIELSRRISHSLPLTEQRPVKNTLVAVVTADKGLAGSFNSNVLRRLDLMTRQFNGESAHNGILHYVAVGRKANAFLRRKNYTPLRVFTGFGDYIHLEEVEPLSGFLTRGFEGGEWDKVLVVSTHFRTTLRQDVVVRDILPISYEAILKTVKEIVPEHGRYAGRQNGFEVVEHPYFEYLIEPSPELVLDNLTRHLVTMAVYHLVLEANASEHSARMVAMKNASDNAEELSEALTLQFNKARQAGITKELAEIVGGVEALKA